MAIGYVAPLGKAYARMKAALFRPFSLRTWIYFGFASWIAGWGAGDSIGSFVFRDKLKRVDLPNLWRNAVETWLDIWTDPLWRGLIFLAAFLIVVLIVVSIWVQSRGEFVFLESVARDRLAITEPWNTFSREGSSLFLWRLAFQGIGFAFAGAVGFAVWRLVLGRQIPYFLSDVAWIPLFVILTLFWLPVTIVLAFVLLLLRHFVAPIMYRDRVKTNEAWRRLLVHVRSNPGAFLGYALFDLGLVILTGIGMIAASCLTCCVLGCLFGIPFVGTVLYLPVSYTFRALGPEFLAQLPSELPVLSPLVVPPPPAPPVA